MINGLNMTNINNSSTNKVENKTRSDIRFGDRDKSQSYHPIRDMALVLTNDLVGLAGVNSVLWAMQKFVNEDILIGKINEHFTKKIGEREKLVPLAHEMWQKKGLAGKVTVDLNQPGQAYFTHEKNKVVVGPEKHSALFHELGHAVEENNTKIFKKLQRGRGNYTAISLLLYTLLAQREKSNGNSKSDAIIPLLAFSPELITEAKATREGLKFLKSKIGEGANMISKSTYKNIKRSYLTCFGTYLFIPISIMLIESLRKSADKAIQRRAERKNGFYI